MFRFGMGAAGFALVLPWYCTGTHWRGTGTALILQQHCTGTALILYWCFTVAALA